MAGAFTTQNKVVIKSHFKKYDTDGSNEISWKEFCSLCYDLGMYVNEVQAQAIMRTMDKDHNSSVQFDEFLKWWQTTDKFKMLDFEANPQILKAIEYFQQYDTDRTGKLGIEEYKKLCFSLGQTFKSEQFYKDGLKALDKNGDGQIDFNEFMDWLKWD
mmetsp:Transcript_5980/g.6524  ORF Transcript_5980/g.6524 Transcript_5980/m.6524 type:complete len:158 (-) Transcript_5980:100-573(-)